MYESKHIEEILSGIADKEDHRKVMNMMMEFVNTDNNAHDIEEDKEEDEVQEWLSNTVGLQQYYPLFIRNGYHTLDTIKNMTANDLRIKAIKQTMLKIRTVKEIIKSNQQQ